MIYEFKRSRLGKGEKFIQDGPPALAEGRQDGMDGFGLRRVGWSGCVPGVLVGEGVEVLRC
jgi:hypothetical protein